MSRLASRERLSFSKLREVKDLPNVATLKREADAEKARIWRCIGDRWQPRRPSLIPERVGSGGGGRY